MTQSNIINLTPHVVFLIGKDNQIKSSFAPSGVVARVTQVLTPLGEPEDAPADDFPIVCEELGEVTGLPVETGSNRIYIVSAMVRTALPRRMDLASPGELVRDDQGRVIGCKNFIVNVP